MKLSKTQLVSLILISILGSTIVTLYLAPILGLDVGDVSTFYLDRGPRYPYSYVVGVWNSTHYYAMNGTTGQREYLSSNMSYILENVIGSGGHTIFFTTGTFEITSTVYPKNLTTFIGCSTRSYLENQEGDGGTVLVVGDASITTMFDIASSIWGVEYRNLWLWGNNKLGTSIEGITSMGRSVFLHNVRVSEFSGNGILASGDGANARGLFQISHCEIGYNGESGITGTYGWVDNFIEETNINANGHHGLYIGPGGGCTVSGGHIEWNTLHGISCLASSLSVCNTRFDRNYFCGVNLLNSSQGLINNCYFYRNAENHSDPNHAAHIVVENGNNTLVTSNFFRVDYDSESYPNYTITLHNADNVTVSNNDMTIGCANQTMRIHYWNMTNFEARHNLGFLFENSGNVEASNDDMVPHGLSYQPTAILLTVEETDANYCVQVKWVNLTHFQVYLYDLTAGALETVDKTINFYAEHNPP